MRKGEVRREEGRGKGGREREDLPGTFRFMLVLTQPLRTPTFSLELACILRSSSLFIKPHYDLIPLLL